MQCRATEALSIVSTKQLPSQLLISSLCVDKTTDHRFIPLTSTHITIILLILITYKLNALDFK